MKGLKSTWRMAPLILRSTLAGALTRILMHDDVQVRCARPSRPFHETHTHTHTHSVLQSFII